MGLRIADCRLRILKKGRGEAEVEENYKAQNPNNKQIPMTEIRNSKYVWGIEYWNLRFICNLVLEIWDFGIRLLACENTEQFLIV